MKNISETLQLPRGNLKCLEYGNCNWAESTVLPTRILPNQLFLFIKSGSVFLHRETKDILKSKNYMMSALNGSSDHDVFLQAQSGIFLNANEPHMLYSNGSVSYIWITFTGDLGVTLSGTFTLTDPIAFLQYDTFLQSNILHPQRLPLCDHLLSLMFSEIWLQKNATEKCTSKLYQNIVEWIQNNSDRPITVNDVAKAVSYNTDYISRLFRQVHPEGIKQYIVNERINRIKYMLITTTLPIQEIAALLHFVSYKQFHKFFSYHVQMSPSEYRKLFIKTNFM